MISFRGRLWATAAAAFPEARGRIPPLKTYVAAFYDEANSAASDRFTFWVRAAGVVVSLLMVVLLNINAVDVWNRMATAGPEMLDKVAATQKDGRDTPALKETLQKSDLLLPHSSSPGSFWREVTVRESLFLHLLGYLLAVAALSLGAPFWFEVLKSAIEMRSAFSKEAKKS